MISFFYFKVELGKYPEKQGLIREHKGLPDGRFTSSVTTSQLWTLMGPDTVGYMDANPKTLHYHLYPKFVWSAVYTGCKIHICTPANQDDILENHHFQQEIHLHSWLDFPASHLIFNRGYGYNHPDFPPDFLYHLGMIPLWNLGLPNEQRYPTQTSELKPWWSLERPRNGSGCGIQMAINGHL